MSIFQKSIVNKHLKNLDKETVNKSFEIFQNYYGDKLRLYNITQLKEENYQEGFLREIFVQVLGFTINPDKNYNLTTEYKNQKDAKKTDGAILKNGNAIGVIELKSTKTKDLESIKEQAFAYKNNQPNCRYVISSNFRNLRFYIDNAIEYEEFDLFNLEKQDFKNLYLFLSKESIFADLPAKMKAETKFHEEDITVKLYRDYKNFKDNIFENLIKNNPKYDKLTLFKKAQKLLDRFLFVFFAEDRGLIPPNASGKIIEDWKYLKNIDEYKSILNLFQKLFKHLNTGYNYVNWGEIPDYNGGFFLHDEILDNSNLKIEDEILLKNIAKISVYDFNSEVDVDILGHIFEHSLAETEKMEKNLSGLENFLNLQIGKRKKDGIFYTPKYITKYIIENTIGTICKEKKINLQINNLLIDENYRILPKKKSAITTKLNKKGEQLFEILKNYKKWLLGLKILDPSCGSGAFLNEALNFLIAENKLIDDLIAELTGDKIRLFDTDKIILEKNIFGVDINEESVEITKLSLWLRTAQKGRKLSYLSENIKCGNSLIDDTKIAGKKAFNWNIEFKKIMKNGGFDILIGNPPWGSKILIKNAKFINKKFNIPLKNLNLFLPFIHLSFNIVKKTGTTHLLVPKVFIKNITYKNTRKIILENYFLSKLINFGVFPNVASETISIAFSKLKPDKKTEIISFYNPENIQKHYVNQNIFFRNPVYALSFQLDEKKANLIDKIKEKSTELSKFVDMKRGIETGQNSKLIKCEKCGIYNVISTKYYSKKVNLCKNCNTEMKVENIISISNDEYNEYYTVKCLSGKGINRYSINNFYYIPQKLKSINYKNHISEKKIFIKRISKTIQAVYFPTNSNILSFNTLYNLYNFKIKPVILLAILNSKLLEFYYEINYNLGMNLTTQITIKYLKELPICKKIINEEKLLNLTNEIIKNKAVINKKYQTFYKRVKYNFKVKKLTKKIKKFNLFKIDVFFDELKKQKIKLSFEEQDKWEDYFDGYKKEINELQNIINQTDNEIDKMVYELYELTNEEIEIIEKLIK